MEPDLIPEPQLLNASNSSLVVVVETEGNRKGKDAFKG